MTVISQPCRMSSCTSECVDRAHIHVRCENCSMPGWWSTIAFHAGEGGEPVPDKGERVVTN